MDGESEYVCGKCAGIKTPSTPEEFQREIDKIVAASKILSKPYDPVEDIATKLKQSMNIIDCTSSNDDPVEGKVVMVLKFGKFIPSRCLNNKKPTSSDRYFKDNKQTQILLEALRIKTELIEKESTKLAEEFVELCKSGSVTESVKRAFFDDTMTKLKENCKDIHKYRNMARLNISSNSNRRVILEPVKNRKPVGVEPIKICLSVTDKKPTEDSKHMSAEPMEDIVHQFQSKVNIEEDSERVLSKEAHAKMIKECRKSIKEGGLMRGASCFEGKFFPKMVIEAVSAPESSKNKGHSAWVLYKRLQLVKRHEKRNTALRKYIDYHKRFHKRTVVSNKVDKSVGTS